MQNKSINSPIHCNSTEMGTAEKAFREALPDINNTSILNELRATEYARLDEQRHIYLDYTGAAYTPIVRSAITWSYFAATSLVILTHLIQPHKQ